MYTSLIRGVLWDDFCDVREYRTDISFEIFLEDFGIFDYRESVYVDGDDIIMYIELFDELHQACPISFIGVSIIVV